MYQNGKKILAMLLVLCMVVGVLPLTAQAALLEGEDYITQQMYLGEDLVFHLRGDVPEAYQNATAIITFLGQSKTYGLNDLTQDENGLYDMPVTVNLAEMTENINLKLKYLGITAIEENYSVAEYLKTLISGNYTNQTKFLALELLNYGAAAQEYFDYNTGNLANAGGYEYPPSNAVPSNIPTAVQSGRVNGISFYGTTVRFLSKTAVRFYFKADSVEGLTFTVDGKQYTPSSNANGYFIEIGGINPQDMETEMVVSVTDGTDTLSVEYAPINYFIRTYHNSENQEMKNLAAAAYSYYVAAKDFVGVEPTGDFMEGVDFEVTGNAELFSGDALIERVSYADAGVSAPANGGSYALKVGHANSCWPNFHVNFGKTLKAGTTITFDFYGNYDSAASGKYMKLELSEDSKKFATTADPNQVIWTLVETWTTGTITLTADSDHIDLFYNVADGQHGDVASWILLDNFKAEEPLVFTGDFETGVGLEDAGDILQFIGQGANQDATIERVSYVGAGVTAPANSGAYALKLSHASHCWPTFRIDFGKTLKAGTTITFDFYGNYDSAADGKYMKLELSGDSKNFAQSADPNQVIWTLVETWKTGTITLTADSDHVDFMYNVADGSHGDVASWILMDNFKAVEPVLVTEGLNFDDAGEANAFTGLTDGVLFEIISFEGNNVLKASHASNCWPNFRINFGQTLKAGTTITFDFYGNYDSAADGKYMKLELTGDSKNFATTADPNQIIWTLVETWKTGTITLTADSDHVDLFYNVADGQHGDPLASWILLDNIKAVEPVLVTEGLNFDDADEARAVTGITDGVMFEIVSFEGNNVLKASHASSCWPNFRINFGKTLKAGTTITFDFYGNYDSAADGKYMKLELTGDSKNFATTADPNQIIWTLVETWKTGTITLTADSDHVDLFYNVADGQHGDPLASWILLDNIKAVEPVLISEGLTFDNSAETDRFTGIGGNDAWRDTSFEIVSFDGNNVLKLACSSSAWPTFRINFGETLKAGTTITFDVYGNYEYEAAEGDTKYMKLELYADSKNFVQSEDPNQVLWTVVETWRTVTITLTADCDHIDFFYNVADGQHGDISSWIMLDNFVVVKP